MPEQEQIKRTESTTTDGVETDEVVAHRPSTAEELKRNLDDVLDDIDAVLEENAEEFVRNYVQKGGQ